MTPTPEQIAKLPKWAQEHIEAITRQREMAVRTLNEFMDEDTPSPFYFEDMVCTGESKGPSNKRRYIQTNSITVEWRGVHLTVGAHNYGNGGKGIRLQWSAESQAMGELAFVPDSYQSARLMTSKDMRP